MKLSAVFKLYKSYYPGVAVQRITVSDTGRLISLSDGGRSFRLNLFPMPAYRAATPSGNGLRNALMAEFAEDNRRELFMLRETRCLYGIVYAENLACDLRLMALVSQNPELPRTQSPGLRLTYLIALADSVSACRYSARSVTLERDGTAYVETGTPAGKRVVKVEAGGKTITAGGKPQQTGEGEPQRYARLFWRDNAEWFANFAAGREQSL